MKNNKQVKKEKQVYENVLAEREETIKKLEK